MAAAKKYVVLADIESIRVPFAVFAAALEELSNFGEVAVCKFYGYSAKRTKDYGEFIQENSYDALSSLPKKRKGKLDLRQVIDAPEKPTSVPSVASRAAYSPARVASPAR